MLQKAFGFAFLFVVTPLCMGLIWTGGAKKGRPGSLYLAGFLTQLAVFQLIAVPIMITQPFGMDMLVKGMSMLLVVLSAAGIFLALRRQKKAVFQGKAADGSRKTSDSSRKTVWAAGSDNLRRGFDSLRTGFAALSWECRIYWLIALAAIGFQLYMSYAYAVFDGDDSYYVVQSVLADQTGVLNRIRPYTGLSTDLDIRHALATLPLWEAYVARMTGIHAAIVAHTLLPLVVIPLTYFAYFAIGRKLLGAVNVKLPIFMTLVSILQICGNTSIYTNATFFLMRTWQGKSVMANLVLLVQIWLLLELFDEKQQGTKRGCWALLAVTNIVAAMMTSMGAFLSAMLLGIVGLLAAVRAKKLSVLFLFAACCIPNAVYLLMLLIMG